MEKIKEAVKNFLKGGDNRDAELLEKTLHKNFQNIQDGFFDKKGIYVFSKSEYIDLVINKTFGGSKRSVEFISVEELGNISIVKVALESEFLKFSSSIVCVFENETWKVISNIPKIDTK